MKSQEHVSVAKASLNPLCGAAASVANSNASLTKRIWKGTERAEMQVERSRREASLSSRISSQHTVADLSVPSTVPSLPPQNPAALAAGSAAPDAAVDAPGRMAQSNPVALSPDRRGP